MSAPKENATVTEVNHAGSIARLQADSDSSFACFGPDNLMDCAAADFDSLVVGQSVRFTREQAHGPQPAPTRVWTKVSG